MKTETLLLIGAAALAAYYIGRGSSTPYTAPSNLPVLTPTPGPRGGVPSTVPTTVPVRPGGAAVGLVI